MNPVKAKRKDTLERRPLREGIVYSEAKKVTLTMIYCRIVMV
jgi:hypothetical protein